jgi:hypothetical protein
MSLTRALSIGVISAGIYMVQPCHETRDFIQPRVFLEKSQSNPLYGLAYVGMVASVVGAIGSIDARKKYRKDKN